MRNRGKTIRDVAQTAGVSISTVSKVFNNNGRIAEETRRHVLQVAADLHFKPNALIRSLRAGQTYTIGVFTWDPHPDPTRDVTAHLSQGIGEGITLAGYDMLVYSHLPERTPEIISSIFMDGRIDGVIIGPMDVSAQGLEALAEAGFPTVSLYRHDVPEGIGSIALDNSSGMMQAVEHLARFGHRQIAYYAPYFTMDYAERAEGYKLALQQQNIAPDPELCFIGSQWNAFPTALACDMFLASSEPPTAILLGDDQQAFLWLAELERRGIRVPEDISLIGFDDVVAAKEAPGLTTLRQPAQEIGVTAARYVKAMIDGVPAEECRTIFPVELVVRGTTAPVRRKQ